MRTVSHAITVGGPLAEVEAFWYDPGRWPTWINGMAKVASVGPDWPATGAKVIWDSTPAGRGRVVERVTSYTPGAGQELHVEDNTLEGTQSVAFSEDTAGVSVSLELTYHIKDRSILTPLVDVLFTRGAMRTSLQLTLSRFSVELASDREHRDG
jgi:hypothetical protein